MGGPKKKKKKKKVPDRKVKCYGSLKTNVNF